MIRLSRAAPRTLLPNQEINITLVVYADTDLRNVTITENLGKGFINLKNPDASILVFDKTTNPDLEFIPKGHTCSLTYSVRVGYTSVDVEKVLILTIINKGRAEAITFTGKNVISKIKTDKFEILAPQIILKDIIVRDDFESMIVILENIGYVDAKSVKITFDLTIDQAFLKINEFIMTISLKDFNNNEYKAKSNMTDRLKDALKIIPIEEADFVAALFDLSEPEEIINIDDIKFKHFEQKDAIEMSAQDRPYPLIIPIAH